MTAFRALLFAPLVLSICLSHPAKAQRPQVRASDVWIGIGGEQAISGPWLASLSVEHRRSNGADVPRQMNLTGTVLRDIGSGRRLGFGIAHYHTSPNEDFGPARPQNERRIFEQVTGSHRFLRAQWNHRLRYEQRWIAADPLPGVERDWVYTSRVRHQVRGLLPLDGRSTSATKLYAAPSLEGFVRTSDHSGVFFDQTRAGLTLGAGVTPRLNAEVGYVRQSTLRADQVREVHDALQVAARILGHARSR